MMAKDRNHKFLDVRNHGFFRVAGILPRIHVGNPMANDLEHIKSIREAYNQGAAYIIGPELGITGYTSKDLFRNEDLQAEALKALKSLVHQTRDMDAIISVGVPITVHGGLYNTAVTFYHGEILAVVPKSYPPTYGQFEEERWFRMAKDATVNEFLLFGKIVPFGTDILIQSLKYPQFVLHTDICEDLWVSVPPGTLAALGGATVLGNLSASNVTIGKAKYRELLVNASAGRNNAVQLYVTPGPGESTMDVAWDNDGYISDRGSIVARSERFAQGSQVIIADVDLAVIQHERTRQTSQQENAARNSQVFRWIRVDGDLGIEGTEVYSKLLRNIEKLPFVPIAEAERDERCEEVFMIQSTALANRLAALPPSMRRVFIGVSGGSDSTHSLLVAAHAFDRMGLPRKDIVGVTMPGFGTTDRTHDNAVKLIEAIGGTFEEISITALSNEMFEAIGYSPESDDYGLTFENVQAWMRFQVLLASSCKSRGIVLGTGDLSEAALGWTTMFGDHSSHYNPNGGVAKTLIKHLIKWAADKIFAGEKEVQAVLEDILATPISPELRPKGEKGEIVQKTESLIGPYILHDFFLYWFVRFGASMPKILRLATHAFEGEYSYEEIRQWLEVFIRRFFGSQFKRNVFMEGPKVGLVSLSPRGDWRMPSDAEKDLWLVRLEETPETL
jgi:NAD+ synthase (glutamine-hydrolysing)